MDTRNKVELISEFEYLPERHELGDGAFGIKWAPLQASLSFGIETLALLPVRPEDDGVGAESQLLATWRRHNHGVQVHVNAGGFHDPRGPKTENGWRASVLTELMEIRSAIHVGLTDEASDVVFNIWFSMNRFGFCAAGSGHNTLTHPM